MNSVIVDCGANVGLVLQKFIEEHPDAVFHAFEPNPNLHDKLCNIIREATGTEVHLHREAVWVSTGTVRLYLDHNISSTLIPGKSASLRWPPINYDRFVTVPSINFAQWLHDNITLGDHVTVKMDIEGAEYAVLQHLVDTRTMELIDVLYVEWHHAKFPSITATQHRELVRIVETSVDLRPWM